jgi:hypothetical protein
VRRPHRALAAALAGTAAVSPASHVLAQGKKPQLVKVRPYADTTKAAAQGKGLDRYTLEALLLKESGMDAKAYHKRSKARGVAQFTPSGAAAVGRLQKRRGIKDWFTYAKTLDPVASIHAAAEFLAFLLELCGGMAEAIRAYNTGSCGKPNAFSRSVMRLAAFLRFATEMEPTS